ncbi:hypothetical protein Cantr_05513 [Candida viswanathii]|uniref:Uncharacterized protein n=1 Tax=Candida viswanathii TaxID=5486 RepID=A0A367XUB5_9ASCO|nr:hypothetical protein Cantr_05513 [Candida viswanathii]
MYPVYDCEPATPVHKTDHPPKVDASKEVKDPAEHEGLRDKYKKVLDEVDEKLVKLPDEIHHGLDKFADGTKKVFHHLS